MIKGCFFSALFLLVTLLSFATVTGQERRPADRPSVDDQRLSGKADSFGQVNKPGFAGGAGTTQETYDPFNVYPGIYNADRLYMKNPASTQWRGSVKPAFIKEVMCAEATRTLYLQGWWLGHINRDGSCGSVAEPLVWATGNFLNFAAGSN